MSREEEGPFEIAVVGDLTETEGEISQKLLDVPPGGACLLYFDSPGGNPYAGLALMSLILLRNLDATGIVIGECSSAALWPFAACRRRMVTSLSVLLFHPMKWQSGENVGLPEAREWARHFGVLESEMDQLLGRLLGADPAVIQTWMQPGRYVSGTEMAEHKLAEMIDFRPLSVTPRPRKKLKKKRPKA
jgi:ATP-dependent Clp protease protease subunit